MNYLTRAQWGAQHPTGPPEQLPALELFIHHTVTVPTSSPAADMRAVENIDFQRFGMGSYSWVFHPPTLTVLEGAGPTIGAHTLHHNSHGFGIAVIGNYMAVELAPAELAALAELVRWLHDRGYLARDAPIRGHRDVRATACPGDRLYAQLPQLRELVANPTGGFLMALSDKQQTELFNNVAAIRQELAGVHGFGRSLPSLRRLILRTRGIARLSASKAGATDAEIDTAANTAEREGT